jgi:ferredoxin
MTVVSAVDADDAHSPCAFDIRLTQTGDTFICKSTESVLQAMTRIGKKGIPVGCLNGGCGVCKIAIHGGRVRKTGMMSRAHISAEEEMQGVVLACRVAPIESIDVEVLGKMARAVMR